MKVSALCVFVCVLVDWTTKSIGTHEVGYEKVVASLNREKGYDTELNINSSKGDT